MKKFIYLPVCLFFAMVSNSCQNDDAIEKNTQSDLEYKEKLEKLVTVGEPTDLKTSKVDLSNALKFKNYEEAYNYFKKNREFASETVTTELKLVPPLYNISKTAKLQSISSTNPINGYDSVSYSQVINDYADVSQSSIWASVNANYSFYCTVQYGYKLQNNTKNYYSFNVGSSNVSSVQLAFSGVGAISPKGALAVSGSGTSLGWTMIYQQTAI